MADAIPVILPAIAVAVVPREWAPGAPSVALALSFFCSILFLSGLVKSVTTPRRVLPVNTDTDKIFREEGRTVLVPRRFKSAREKAGAAMRKVTMAELRRHNSEKDLWIAIDGHAYDMTKYVQHHPGGALLLIHMAGKDATDQFANYHPASVYKTLLPQYHVGEIVDQTVSEFIKEHRSLRQELLRRGLFETEWGFYTMQAARYLALFGTAMWLTFAGTMTAHRMLGAACLAIYWQQSAFLGHDAGHNVAMQRKRTEISPLSVFCTMTGGISVSWWKHNHNVHHVVCNSVEHDPDVQHQPIMAASAKAFSRFTSSFYGHEFALEADAIGQGLVSYQHYLFFPVMTVARFFLYFRSWMHILFYTGKNINNRGAHIAQQAIFTVGLLLLCASLPTWQESIEYLLLSHGLAGVLHLQIIVSHFPMEVYNGLPYNDDSDEWLITQVRTTQNIACETWMDWFHGGLQFQIEHHMWPRLPRHNLREARAMLKPFCAKYNVPYVEQPFIPAVGSLVDTLHGVAMKAREFPEKANFFDSAVWNLLNARG